MCRSVYSFIFKICIFYCLINSSLQTDGELFLDSIIRESITISDGSRLIDKFSLDLYTKHIPKNSNIKFDITGKLAYTENLQSLLNILKKYEDFYNNRWVNKLN